MAARIRRIRLGRAVREFGEHLDHRVAVGTLAASTRDRYVNDLNELLRILGRAVVLADLTEQELARAVTEFGAAPDRRYTDPVSKPGPGRSAGTRQRFGRSVSAFLTHAERNGWIAEPPSPPLAPTPPAADRAPAGGDVLTAAQLQALLTLGPTQGGRPHERNLARDRFILTLLALLGPRVSEICRADTDDLRVDRDRSAVWKITGADGTVDRIVPLYPILVRLFLDYQQDRPPPPSWMNPAEQADARRSLVVSGRGVRMDPRDIQRLLQRAARRVQARDPAHAMDITPHTLRHTAAVQMLGAGWPTRTVAGILGISIESAAAVRGAPGHRADRFFPDLLDPDQDPDR